MIAAHGEEDAAASFDPLRPLLTRVAYRMLGSVADAEDVVQDAFLCWLETRRADVRVPEAFLRRVVTRLCLDVLKSARHRREIYVGPWLPEPVIQSSDDEIDDVTLPLMLALERLSPLERAAFLLHDVFGVGFQEVAEIISRARLPAGSWRAGRECTCGPPAHASRCRRTTPSKSHPPSSPPHAAATCKDYVRSWPRM